MKILHVGSAASPNQVDGVNRTVWLVAKAQASLGHSVALLVEETPDEAASKFAKEAGLELFHISAKSQWYKPQAVESLLRSYTPSLIHMHSVFLLKQAALARQLVKAAIPYIITPHGGLNFQRSRFKKNIYCWLIEKSRFSRASAISVVTPKEVDAVRALVPNYCKSIQWIPNPVNVQSLETRAWKEKANTKQIVFLGRFDVLHKGIDILIAIARFAPDIEFHLYGTEDEKTKAWLNQLKCNLPSNVYFHQPVFGQDKAEVLSSASMYLQTSRWEGFPISIAEAMCTGIPCAISEQLGFAELFHKHDLGLLLPQDPSNAAASLQKVLEEPQQLQHWSKQAQEFAQKYFQPDTVASNYLKLYEEVLSL